MTAAKGKPPPANSKLAAVQPETFYGEGSARQASSNTATQSSRIDKGKGREIIEVDEGESDEDIEDARSFDQTTAPPSAGRPSMSGKGKSTQQRPHDDEEDKPMHLRTQTSASSKAKGTVNATGTGGKGGVVSDAAVRGRSGSR